MKVIKSYRIPFSTAAKTGLTALLLATLLIVVDGWLAIIPLAGFLLLCLAAPFFPRFGFYLPVISKGASGKKAVAITFDDGPDPLTTPLLLKLLLKRQTKATFFVIGQKAAAHPKLIKEIVRQGHLIGNHSYKHSYRMLFRTCLSIVADIEATQKVLNGFGVRPLAFRPPAGITSPRLRPALLKTGMYLVNYSCRSLDGGNRRISSIAKRILKRIGPDDIVLLHDNRQPDEGLIPAWLNEIELLLAGIETKGLAVLPLSELIGKPVMISMIGGVEEAG
ncbi:MAG: polysaccharide deacetylase family protein [bacterium]|nr:polysaccharide deacetylase family protein [bacterium]